MTVTITGVVTVGGVDYPVEVPVTLPEITGRGFVDLYAQVSRSGLAVDDR